MLTYHSTTGLFNYPEFSAENINDHIIWEDIESIVSLMLNKIFKDASSNLQAKDPLSFTEEEVIALCSLPLIKPVDHDSFEFIRLDLNDLKSRDNISSIIKYSVPFPIGHETKMIGLRLINVNATYSLPKPGYRIQTGTMTRYGNNNIYIISIIMDKSFPKDEKLMVRFAGELTEVLVQYYLREIGIKSIYYESPDYSVYEEYEDTNYKATGTLALKDYPSIRDLMFAYKYINTIFNGMVDSFKISGVTCNLSDEDIINSYFGVDYHDGNSWLVEFQDLKKILGSTSENLYLLVLEKVLDLYFNKIAGEEDNA